MVQLRKGQVIVDKKNKELMAARNDSGLTQVQIAEKAGISVAAYQRYEYGNRKPSAEIAIRIAEALGMVEFEDFKKLFGVPAPNKSSTN